MVKEFPKDAAVVSDEFKGILTYVMSDNLSEQDKKNIELNANSIVVIINLCIYFSKSFLLS